MERQTQYVYCGETKSIDIAKQTFCERYKKNQRIWTAVKTVKEKSEYFVADRVPATLENLKAYLKFSLKEFNLKFCQQYDQK